MPDQASEQAEEVINESRSVAKEPAQEMNQIELIVHKGLDIAEAGIELGFSVISRLGLILKNQLLDSDGQYYQQDYYPEYQSQAEKYPDYEEPPIADEHAAEEEGYYLTNRLPLHPGDAVSISFSMNNDSISEEKTITLSTTDFVGTTDNFVISADNFALNPASQTIAPVDFEKFILSGNLDAGLKPDTYYGSIIVEDIEKYKIPVVLEITENSN